MSCAHRRHATAERRELNAAYDGEMSAAGVHEIERRMHRADALPAVGVGEFEN